MPRALTAAREGDSTGAGRAGPAGRRPAARSLRARLMLWYTAGFSGLLLVFGVTAFVLLDRGLRANVDDSLTSVARAIATSSAKLNTRRVSNGSMIASICPLDAACFASSHRS